MEANTPIGRWTDPLHKPRVATGSVPTAAREPAILQKEDGTTYLIFGCWDYYIARLNDDMISLAQTPRKLELDRKLGPYGPGKTDDKPFLHEYNGKYYLSWGCFYAMADNVYGPYAYKGCIITNDRTEPEFRTKLVFDRHGSFFELHHQWYFICNDQRWPGTSAHYRDSVISYVHHRDNGEIDPVYIDRLGVGQYDANRPRINAANFFDAGGVKWQESPDGGFELANIQDGSYAEYPNVRNLPANATMTFRLATCTPQKGTIEIHQSSKSGPLLGSCPIPGRGRWKEIPNRADEVGERGGSLGHLSRVPRIARRTASIDLV
jgi:arabinoxylan arabinofuranohydrolase